LFNSDRASVGIEILENGMPNAFFEQLINGIIDRILNDVYLGDGVPSSSLGEEGDLYIDITGKKHYVKGASAWDAGTALDNNSDTVQLVGP